MKQESETLGVTEAGLMRELLALAQRNLCTFTLGTARYLKANNYGKISDYWRSIGDCMKHDNVRHRGSVREMATDIAIHAMTFGGLLDSMSIIRDDDLPDSTGQAVGAEITITGWPSSSRMEWYDLTQDEVDEVIGLLIPMCKECGCHMVRRREGEVLKVFTRRPTSWVHWGDLTEGLRSFIMADPHRKLAWNGRAVNRVHGSVGCFRIGVEETGFFENEDLWDRTDAVNSQIELHQVEGGEWFMWEMVRDVGWHVLAQRDGGWAQISGPPERVPGQPVPSLEDYRRRSQSKEEAMVEAYLSGAYSFGEVADFFGVGYMDVAEAVRNRNK